MLVVTWVKSSVWKLGVHQGSCLSPLLFTTVLEALPKEFCTGYPWENLCANNLVIVTELLEELQEKEILQKTSMEGKGLTSGIDMGKTKVLISGPGFNLLQKPDKDPCAVCLKDIGTNSIFCGGCSSWVHKKCIGISGPLKPDPSFRYKRCTGQARPVDGRPMTEVTVVRDKLELGPPFCYLEHCLSSGGGCQLVSITRCRAVWSKFHEHHVRPHLPLISHHIQR